MKTAFGRLAPGVVLLLGIASGAVLAQSAEVGGCPQPRFTDRAPDDYYNRANPLQATPENLAAGEDLFLGDGRKVACATCHGKTGAGDGPLANQFDPPPRNFTCAKTINGIPDGHLFWIIRFGSPGTSMPRHKRLSEEQIWQLVLHLRHLAR